MQASQYYLKLVRFMDSCKDEEMLEVLGKITNITFVDAHIDFDISLGFNTRSCRVLEGDEEKCVYEIQNNKLYIRPEQKNDILDIVQDTEDKYKQKFYDYIIQEDLECKERQELEWEQEEEDDDDDSEYTTEKVIDEGKVGHWSDDDDDDEE
jgi:hypothetical protein